MYEPNATRGKTEQIIKKNIIVNTLSERSEQGKNLVVYFRVKI